MISFILQLFTVLFFSPFTWYTLQKKIKFLKSEAGITFTSPILAFFNLNDFLHKNSFKKEDKYEAQKKIHGALELTLFCNYSMLIIC